jgi:hypothetical protein
MVALVSCCANAEAIIADGSASAIKRWRRRSDRVVLSSRSFRRPGWMWPGFRFCTKGRRRLARILLIVRGLGPDQPKVGDAIDIPDPDQTEHLGSVTGSCEPTVLGLPGIPWSAQIKRLLHRLLIDHPYDRNVRN